MEQACEAAVEPGRTSSSTDHLGDITSSCSSAETQQSERDAFLLGLLGAACGGVAGAAAGAAAGAVGGVCAAAYSLISEDISALGVAAGLLGSVVGGVVGGVFCGAVGGAVGATAGPRPWLLSDVSLATVGCATGGAIGCSFHKTVGTIGGATGAAFGALTARDCTSRLVQSFRLNGDVAQLMQPLQLLIKQQEPETQNP